MQVFNCFLLTALALAGAGVFAARSDTQCKVECQRVPKVLQNFGYDAALRYLSIDVGECKQIEKNCTVTKQSNQYACDKKECTVRSRELWTYTNRDGQISVPVIKNCYPTWHHCQSSCVRKPNILYVFPQSKYQTRVDVGKCTGNCTDGKECLAVSTKNVSVEGPNGAVLIETIEKCDCVSAACYRADYYESYWDYGVGNTTKRENKVINMGKCVGTCKGVLSEPFCLPGPENCQLYFEPRQTKCAPLTHENNTYTDSAGNLKSVISIKECGCGLG